MDSTNPTEQTDVEMMLKMLRHPVQHPDSFEDTFIQDLHMRLVQDSSKQTIFSVIRERMIGVVEGFSGWKWVYGGMTAATACVVTFFVISGDVTPDSGSDIYSGTNGKSLVQPVSVETTLPTQDAQEAPKTEQKKPTPPTLIQF